MTPEAKERRRANRRKGRSKRKMERERLSGKELAFFDGLMKQRPGTK